MPSAGAQHPGSSDGLAGSWGSYYANTGDRPPRKTVLTALDLLAGAAPGSDLPAVDLGCGGGRDTAAILAAGWRVIGIDAAADAGDVLRNRFPAAWQSGQLTFLRQDFTAPEVQCPAARFVNASFCLPSCPPENFPALWTRISGSLADGGVFAGHLYGPRDSWAKRGDRMTFHSKTAVQRLFSGWEIRLCDEEETDSVTPRGREKHWHLFHIVAQKPY